MDFLVCFWIFGVFSEFFVKNVGSPVDKGIGPGPGWGPVRVRARSGLGPYGPIRALMLVFRSEALRVQTAPFEKIRTDLWRSPEASTHLRPSGSQKTKA